jgi:hypothetical protein
MRKAAAVFVSLVALASSASAQTKMSGKLSCPKPDVNSSAEIGDAPGHMLVLQKATCTWTTPWDIAGAKAKTAIDASTTEVNGATATNRGFNTTTLDNGDKAAVSYQGTSQMKQDGSGTFHGTWKFTSGTGKAKGVKGGGTFKGTASADGTSMVEVVGEYSLAAAPTKKSEPAPPPKKP